MQKLLNTMLLAVGLTVVAVPVTVLADTTTNTSTETTTQYTNGSVITTKVKSALLSASGIDSNDIKVQTEQPGVVILSGTQQNQAQINRAKNIALGVQGVNKVINNLTIAPK